VKHAAVTLPPGTLLAGKFRIERRLGAGAMGAVYAIVHEFTHHRRALKLLHPEARLVPDLVSRFLDEASAAGRVGNAHLVETFDAGVLPTGEPYVVMELLEGETLGALLKRERPLSVERSAEIVAQAAQGIDAANRAGIIHRDLKPENLFVTATPTGPFVKVLDFGVSKFTTASGISLHATQTGALYGSPAYMSPEQLRADSDVDARVDVFGLGVVLFESLTGALPYDAPDLLALRARVLTGRPTRIETLRPEVPRELAKVVHRAIAQRRDERFASAREFAEALAPFRAFDGAPGVTDPLAADVAPAAGARSEFGLPGKRRRIALVAALVALLGGASWVGLARSPTASRPAAPPASSDPIAAPPMGSAAGTVPPAELQAAPPVPPSASSEPLASAHPRSEPGPVHGRPRGLPTGGPSSSASASSNTSRIGLAKHNPFTQ
jgi:serine/threonine-protein kinase